MIIRLTLQANTPGAKAFTEEWDMPNIVSLDVAKGWAGKLITSANRMRKKQGKEAYLLMKVEEAKDGENGTD